MFKRILSKLVKFLISLISIELLLLLIFNLLVFLGLLMFKSQLAYGDLPPFPESYQTAFEDFFYVWKNFSFGLYRYPGQLQPLLQGLLLLLFGSPVLAQKVYMFFLPVMAFLGFKYLLKSSYKSVSRISGFITAFFYAYSPIFIQEFMGGTLYSTLLGFALFPVVFAKSIQLYEDFNLRRVLILALILGGIVSFYPHFIVIYSISMFVPFVLDVLLNRFNNLKIWLGFFLVGVLVIVLNPIFVLTSFNLVNTSSGVTSSSFSANVENFLNDVHYTYYWSTFGNIFRFGNNNSPHGYSEQSWWTYQFYAIVTFVFGYCFIFRRKKWNGVFWFSLFPSLILIMGFVYFTHLNKTDWLFKLFSPLILFRNPAKLTYLSFFFFSLLFFEALNFVESRSKTALVKYIFFVPISISILIYIWPVFTQDLSLSKYRSGFTLPNVYKEVISRVEKGEGRNFWLPSSHESTSIKLAWLDQNKLESQIGVNQFSDDYFVDEIINPLNASLLKSKEQEMKNLLNIAQVKNVILLKDKKDNISTETLFGTGSIVGGSQVLSSYLDFLPKLHDTKSYSIYHNDTYYPTFFVPDTFAYVDDDAVFNGFLNTINPEAKIALIKSSFFSSFPSSSFSVIWPSKKHTNFVMSGWDPLWIWPSVSVDPRNEAVYSLVRLKENFIKLKNSDFSERIETLLWLASKRVEEVSEFNITQGNLRSKILAEYYASMSGGFILLEGYPSKTDSRYQKFLRKYSEFLKRGLEKANVDEQDGELGSKLQALLKEAQKVTLKFDYNCGLDICFYGQVPKSANYELNLGLEYKGQELIEAGAVLSSVGLMGEKVLAIPLKKGPIQNLGEVYLEKDHYYELEIAFPPGENLVSEGPWIEEIEQAPPDWNKIDFIKTDSYLFPLLSNKKYSKVSQVMHKKIKSINEKGSFRLTFDYLLDNGDLGYAVVQRDKNTGNYIQAMGGRVSPNVKSFENCLNENCFSTLNKTFQTSGLGEDARVIFFVASNNKLSKLATIKNVALEQVQDIAMHLKAAGFTDYKPLSIKPKLVKLRPFLYKVEFEELTSEIPVVFNQSFHRGWKLFRTDTCKGWIVGFIPRCRYFSSNEYDENHTRINGFANGWVIKPQDSTNISFYIIFVPQIHFFMSLIFSLVVLIVFLLIYLRRKTFERRNLWT